MTLEQIIAELAKLDGLKSFHIETDKVIVSKSAPKAEIFTAIWANPSESSREAQIGFNVVYAGTGENNS